MGTHNSSFQEEAPRMDILRNGCGPPSVPWTPDLLVCLVSVRCRLSLNLYSRFSRGGGQGAPALAKDIVFLGWV